MLKFIELRFSRLKFVSQLPSFRVLTRRVQVLEVLRTRYSGSLSQNVRGVRRQWMQVHGPGHNDGATRKALKRILKVMQREASSLSKKTSSDRKKSDLKQLKIA